MKEIVKRLYTIYDFGKVVSKGDQLHETATSVVAMNEATSFSLVMPKGMGQYDDKLFAIRVVYGDKAAEILASMNLGLTGSMELEVSLGHFWKTGGYTYFAVLRSDEDHNWALGTHLMVRDLKSHSQEFAPCKDVPGLAYVADDMIIVPVGYAKNGWDDAVDAFLHPELAEESSAGYNVHETPAYLEYFKGEAVAEAENPLSPSGDSPSDSDWLASDPCAPKRGGSSEISDNSDPCTFVSARRLRNGRGWARNAR